MHVHYISPSTLPSRAANSVHVAWQCDGLVRAGAQVTLYAKRSVPNAASLPDALGASYGIDANRMTIVSYFTRYSWADNVSIATMAMTQLVRQRAGDAILSRNLYAAFVLGVIQRRPLIFETHQLEPGARKILQRMLITRPWITTVAISNKLVEHLTQHHQIAPRHALVLPDAAPEGIVPLDKRDRRATLQQLVPAAMGDWDAVCGYFGHLYQGRGLEVIKALAASRPRLLFLVYGGNDGDAETQRSTNAQSNLAFMGHVAHPQARRIMAAMDVLLMPYQPQVSIGVTGHDTAQWMSPMKMFEYLATGVPIIASRLPALGEVLENGRNCLMADPEDRHEWLSALDRILSSPGLASEIGERAHEQYKTKHTWTRRAESLLVAARSL